MSVLEVHHIESLDAAWHLRLDDENLITVCDDCHELAERGEIAAADLREIAKTNTERTDGGEDKEPPAFIVL
jgi:predicted HNH restriction endonuclease